MKAKKWNRSKNPNQQRRRVKTHRAAAKDHVAVAMTSRSNPVNITTDLVMMTATVSLGAVVVAFLAYNSSLLLETKLVQEVSRCCPWRRTPEQLARHRAARYRRRSRQARISPAQPRGLAILLTDPEMLQGLVEEIFGWNSDKMNPFYVVDRIEQNRDGEYILRLIRSGSGAGEPPRTTICVLLLPFCRLVLDTMPIINTTKTTLCFVYDTTGGQGGEIIARLLLEEIDSWLVVAAWQDRRRPHFWMEQWSTDLHLSKENKDLILQALVRVEETAQLRRRQQQQIHHAVEPKQDGKLAVQKSIVVFTISTEYVPILMAGLYSAFPDDKHVFLYRNCVQAVLVTQQLSPVGTITPLKPLVSIHLRRQEFHAALAKLPSSVAASVEAWVAAVDSLILLQDDYSSNGFRPYVCRLEYLLEYAAEDNNDATERRWAVRSLLQYCCGATTGAAILNRQHIQAAMMTIPMCQALPPSTKYVQEIDAVVFCHNRILTSHRVLPDTVPPVECWTLKQPPLTGGPTTGGCACCIGTAEEEMEEEQLQNYRQRNGESIMTRSSASSFVDGKLGFAFDPSRFG